MLTMGWLGVQRVLIQRRRCKQCGKEIIAPERVRQAEARRAWWEQVDRLIGLSRFKLGLSVRKIRILIVLYNKFMSAAGLHLTHLRDSAHLMRQIVRLFDEAVREVTLDVPKGLPLEERKKQRQLKRRLLRKRLQPILALAFKAFSPGYESVCVLMLEGVISQLEDSSIIIQTAGVQRLARRLRRFVKKHGHATNLLLQLSVKQSTPTTTNALESKNSIFKPFSLIAKFFSLPDKCESLFAEVALMENFDVKTRGPNKGTSAMQRAAINLADFGATDFFSAVGLPKPQISPAYVTE